MKELKAIEVHKVDHVYPNTKRIYPRDEMQHALDVFMMRKEKGMNLVGEFGNPAENDPLRNVITGRMSTIDTSMVSHEVEKIWIDDYGVVRADVKTAGPFGLVLAGRISAGGVPKFGMRAIMADETVNGVIQPKPGTLAIVCFDLIDMQGGM